MLRLLLLVLLVLLLLVLGAYAWHTRHATFADVRQDAAVISGAEAGAVAALLEAAGVAPGRLRVVATAPEVPCWAGAHWSRWDRWLGTDRRFGPPAGGDGCIGVDGGHVVSLALTGTRLAEVAPLARLPALRHLRLGDNRLAALPPLGALRQLESLDVRGGALEEASALAGHPRLERVELYGNRLATLEGVAEMPRLAYLGVGGNRLTTLAGLRDLPALRTLQAGSNRLGTVEVGVLAALPALAHVSLSNNDVGSVPPGYALKARPAVLAPEDGGLPELDLGANPVAAVLRQQAEARQYQADARHDGTQVHHAGALPRGRGRWQGTTRRGSEHNGLSASHLDVRGTAAWLDGAQSLPFALRRQAWVTATASVEKGRLRLYLADPDGAYRYAEALPGRPLRLSGRLISGTRYFVYFESVGGRAEGIRWTVTSR